MFGRLNQAGVLTRDGFGGIDSLVWRHGLVVATHT